MFLSFLCLRVPPHQPSRSLLGGRGLSVASVIPLQLTDRRVVGAQSILLEQMSRDGQDMTPVPSHVNRTCSEALGLCFPEL